MLRTQSTTRSPYPNNSAQQIPKLLIERFDQTFAFRRKVVTSSDRECIGAMDWASQRLYLALSDFKPYLDQQRVSYVEVKLRSVADAIAKVRHQDMAIVALEKMVLQTRPELAKTAKYLIDSRKEVRQISSKTLQQLLFCLRSKALRMELACSASSMDDSSPRKMAQPFKSVAVIRKRLSEFEAYGNRLCDYLTPLH